MFECISVALEWLAIVGRDNLGMGRRLETELISVRGQFAYPIFDLGVATGLGDVSIPCSALSAARAAGFTPRVITRGQHFQDLSVSAAQIQSLVKSGARQITLRLDSENLKDLPMRDILHYVESTAAVGLESDIRLEYTDCIPERFFTILRDIEAVRFYTKTYTIRVHPVSRKVIKHGELFVRASDRLPRVVVTGTGSVILRERSDTVVETEIGHIGSTTLWETLQSAASVGSDMVADRLL